MNLPTVQNGMVVMPRDEFEQLLDRAAERGVERMLSRLGLENGHAARDIRELRDLLEAWRDARRIAWQTIVKIVTTGFVLVLIAGAILKIKLFGGQ